MAPLLIKLKLTNEAEYSVQQLEKSGNKQTIKKAH
jgi:hypothetical protein